MFLEHNSVYANLKNIFALNACVASTQSLSRLKYVNKLKDLKKNSKFFYVELVSQIKKGFLSEDKSFDLIDIVNRIYRWFDKVRD